MRESKQRTKIVCTIGPGSSNPDTLEKMLQEGMSVARFNFSHGSHDEHRKRINLMRAASEKTGVPVAIMIDMKGPEVRTGVIEGGSICVNSGDMVILTTEQKTGTISGISVSYLGLGDDLRPGNMIYIDDGLVSMRVMEIAKRGSFSDIYCIVINGGLIENRKSINVPEASLELPALSESDIEDIKFAVEEDVDFIAVSFARTADDIVHVRNHVKKLGGNINLIAKIENRSGIDNVESILQASDGLMVARGDLGIEIPVEEVPIAQKKLIRESNKQGKPVITATQMLDSMIRNPRPTRAESGDVANAIFDGTDAVMLSGETAMGLYPVESVRMMSKICKEAESFPIWQELNYQNIQSRGFLLNRFEKTKSMDNNVFSCSINERPIPDAVSKAACSLAEDISAKALLVSTESGFTASKVSKLRPAVPIIAGTPDEKVFRTLLLRWGVTPIITVMHSSTDMMIAGTVDKALEEGLVKKGDLVVLTAGVPVGIRSTNLIKAHVVGEKFS
ncbi:MAG: pyruvate kinase [Methanosarcinaceae archaeon]|nr:pyruvate kinase [Methanosarcinaceae archaeon]